LVRDGGKKDQAPKIPGLSPDVRVFSVYPESIQLEGKSAFEFQFVANCPKPGMLEEKLECLEFAGSDRKGKQTFLTTVKGVFGCRC
jgi:hypothetical protein